MFDINIDEKRFAEAVALARIKERRGIGELDEKLLHAALKNYFAPPERQEVRIGRSVVDAVGEGTLYEIQTGGCYPLKKKLPALLQKHAVTVVCPIMRERTLYWIDKDTGERSSGRRSPKRGERSDILPELMYLDRFFDKEGFSLLLFFYDGEEYRLKDGWANGGKRGAHRVNRVPTKPVGITAVEGRCDYAKLLPPLPERFSARDFSRLTRRKGRTLWAILKVLTQTGIIEREKNRRAYVYRVCGTEKKGTK